MRGEELEADGGELVLVDANLVEYALEALSLDGRKSAKELEGDSLDAEEGEGYREEGG